MGDPGRAAAYSIRDVAQRASVSEGFVRHLIAVGALPAEETGLGPRGGLARAAAAVVGDGRLSVETIVTIVGIRPSSLADAPSRPPTGPASRARSRSRGAGSEVNLLFHVAAPPVHHEVMIARFDKAAKDEVEDLAGRARACGPRG